MVDEVVVAASQEALASLVDEAVAAAVARDPSSQEVFAGLVDEAVVVAVVARGLSSQLVSSSVY